MKKISRAEKKLGKEIYVLSKKKDSATKRFQESQTITNSMFECYLRKAEKEKNRIIQKGIEDDEYIKEKNLLGKRYKVLIKLGEKINDAKRKLYALKK